MLKVALQLLVPVGNLSLSNSVVQGVSLASGEGATMFDLNYGRHC